MEKLYRDILKKSEKLKGNVSVIIKDFEIGESIKINENDIFPSASMIKIPIIIELFSRVISGEISLQERISLKSADKVGGFGILKEFDEGVELTYKDLAMLMIVLSDNVATNILIDELKIENINSTIKDMNLKSTSLQRKMMDSKAKLEGLDNYTSASDLLIMFESILKNNSYEKILDIMTRQQCNNKLPYLIDENIKFAHKTGDLPGVEHDGGIMFINDRPIIVIVLTKNLEDNNDGVELNNYIGKCVYEYYKGERFDE